MFVFGSAQLVAMMEADAAGESESKSNTADCRAQQEAQAREEEEKSEAEKKEWEEAQELLAYADDLERALPQVKGRPRKLAQQRIAGVKDLLRRV